MLIYGMMNEKISNIMNLSKKEREGQLWRVNMMVWPELLSRT